MSFAGVALVSFAREEASPPTLHATVRRAAGRLTLEWHLTGVASLRWPPHGAAPARADRLWEHTCFEAFLAPADRPAYWELNVSPAGDWQLYRFVGYREGMAVEEAMTIAPAITASHADGAAAVRATLDLGAIPGLAAAALDVGLAAVLEAGDGTCTYWALRHPGTQPDFHRRDAFALRLPAEEGA